MGAVNMYRLRFDDGQRVEVAGFGVIGRNPSVHTPGDEIDFVVDPVRVTIPDETKTVSRAHLVFGLFEGAFWVSDLGSGNGTTLTYPDGNTYPCTPGTRYEVDPGSTIGFGSRTFVLETDGPAAGSSQSGTTI